MANRFLNNIKINDSYTLPAADGTADQIIVTDGAGNLSFNDLNTVTESITGVQSNFTYYEVKNSSGAAIAEFKAVMAVGTDGNSGHILIDEMVADGSVEARYLLGITMDGGIANGEIGRVVAFGEIDQINTLAFSDGDVLWCDPANNGDFTITEPDGPNLKIPAAIVLNSATNGKIQVRVQTNEGIKDLYDTKIASQIDGDVLVWDNTTGVWFNDSTLNVDYTNGNVGIGTTSPDSKLEVASTGTNTYLHVRNDSTGSTRLKMSNLSDTNSNGFQIINNGSNGQVNLLNYKTSTLALWTNATQRLTILSNGNVGIGTTSPSSKLEVNTGTDGVISRFRGSTNTGVTISGGTYGGVALSAKIHHESSNRNLVLETNGTGKLYFNTNGANARMVITDGGNVGIGTTSPAEKLDVAGNITVSGTGSFGSTVDAASPNINNWIFKATNSDFASESGFYDANNHVEMILRNSSDTIAAHIKSSGSSYFNGGNVGIGTTAPAEKLAVNGSIRIPRTEEFYWTDGSINGSPRAVIFSTNNEFGGDYNGIGFSIGANGRTNPSMYIRGTGKVGIGTTNPGKLLELSGGANVAAIRLRDTTSNVWDIQNSTNGTLDFIRGGTNTYMRINQFGNVSIGTDTTSAKLEVRQSANNGNTGAFTNTHVKLTASATADNTGFVGITAATSTSDNYGYSFGAQRTSGGVGSFKINYHNNSASGTNRFIIDQNGNVGIGTTNPSTKLHVANGTLRTWTPTAGTTAIFESTANSRSFITITGANESELWFGDATTQAKGRVRYENANNMMEFWTNQNPRMYITSAGNVGIGTTNPSYKLDVSGTIRATGDVIAYSDIRVKENIKTIDNAVNKVKALRGVEYNKIDSTEKSIGVIAQEIEQIIPEVVKEDDQGMKSVAYGNITAVLIEAIKEQQKQIDELKAIINGSSS